MNTEQKAKAFDEIVSRIEVSAGWWDDIESAKEWLECMLRYTLGIYAACHMSWDQILADWDTETPDGEYDSVTRWMFCPIDDLAWYYGYKSWKKIMNTSSN